MSGLFRQLFRKIFFKSIRKRTMIRRKPPTSTDETSSTAVTGGDNSNGRSKNDATVISKPIRV
jgi:hypothetical protein